MKKVLLLFTILFVSVITTACINNFAIQELNNKAAAYMDKGDTETAICRLKSSLDLDTEIFQTHYNLAVAYNSIEKYEESIVEAQKAIDLKPDFFDAYYAMAVSKEAIAYQFIDKTQNEDETSEELTLDDIIKFNDAAQDAIDTYNEYLVKKVDAKETDEINTKISELNAKIKEFTQKYNLETTKKDKQIEEELTKDIEEVEEEATSEENEVIAE